VGPFLTTGVVLASAVGILIGALVTHRRWVWVVAAAIGLVAAAIPPVAVHAVPALSQLAEHPVKGLTQVLTARPDNNPNIYLIRDDGEIVRLTDTSATETNAALSPDGHTIAYSSNAEGSFDVYVMTLDSRGRTSDVQRLTSLPGDEYVEHWSPDGSTITFDSVIANSSDVLTIRWNGTGLTALTTDGTSWGGAWSPDGTLLAFAHPAVPGDPAGIWTMSPDGSHRRLVIDFAGMEFNPSWSPDGTRLLFTSDSSGNSDVWIVDADGRNARNLTIGWVDKDGAIGWTPDGTVLFASDRSHTGGVFVYAMSADGLDVRLVVII
jgi:Tol biopolymer transport system component